jgi:hypothetical protein
LIWATVAACTLTLTAPGTVPSPVSHRLVAWAIRTVSYFGITVLFLYAGNLTERELPRRKLVWLLGLIAIYTTVLGVAAIAAPHLQFTSPTALILPHSLQSNTFIQATTHPGLAQVQNVFGTASAQGRPKAPFDYTNTWGDCLTITVPWLLVVCLGSGAGLRRRLIGWATLLFALLGLLYSLNRGAWIAAGFAVVYLAVRLAARGRTGVMGGLVALLGIAVIVGLSHRCIRSLAYDCRTARATVFARVFLHCRCTTAWPPRSSASATLGSNGAARNRSPSVHRRPVRRAARMR